MDSNINTLLIFLLLLLTAINSNDANAAFAPTSVQRVITTSTGATATTVFSRLAANQAIYDIRAVQVAKASIANAARTRAFSPYGFALVAAITAAGYYLSEDDRIMQQPNFSFDGLGQCSIQYFGLIENSTFAQCIESAPSEFNGDSYSGNSDFRRRSDRQVTFQYDYNNGSNWRNVIWTAYDTNTVPDDFSSEPTELSDSPLLDVVYSLPNSDWQQLFEDPITGKPNPDITEFQDAANDAESDYQYANDGDPNTSPSLDPETGDTGTQNQTEQEPKDEDPCIKNPRLLMCSELDDVPEKTDIDTQDIDFDYEPYQLSGNSTCPANLQLPRGLELNYEPACDFATGISPVVILVFSIIGMYILGGYRMTD